MTRHEDDGELFEETVNQRRSLVCVLSGLSESEWDTASLCAGWRIREVLAPITMPYRYSGRAVVVEILKAGGKFDVAADRLARRDTSMLSSAELLRTPRTPGIHRGVVREAR